MKEKDHQGVDKWLIDVDDNQDPKVYHTLLCYATLFMIFHANPEFQKIKLVVHNIFIEL